MHGTQFRFVLIKHDHFFGTTRHRLGLVEAEEPPTKQEPVHVSDLERTVIDGLRHPKYCGGVTEVAKGLWMRHHDMKSDEDSMICTLVAYALRMKVGAVTRRLGYLLELYGLAPEEDLARLRETLTPTWPGYVPLDPLLPKDGKHLKRWRLQLNITSEELESVRTT